MNDAHILDPAEATTAPTSARRDKPAGPHLQAAFWKQLTSEGHEFALEVDFQIAPGFNILFGASGAGKTMLLDCVAGLVTPDAGRIAIGDRVLYDAAQRVNIPVAKRGVGYVFQNLALFPHLTVTQNVQYGLTHLSSSERSSRTAAIL